MLDAANISCWDTAAGCDDDTDRQYRQGSW